ncbi:branched-chain amino acid ABC transporter permease (plasmid) [Paracoccus versutus]|uniref:Amino acid/amide ABC transporter membrane protein 1 (HAAT family) n=1 Tax=Paracoccus versutus TaxID=34007 RepID=A0A099FDE8_PARVE|nr:MULTISPECIES: branched-chain amino acid ABC transporter permease [Paracoccus]SFY35416.1 branched-chain amino acid transport system permease protein [Paracoccus pantotrophus]KGJ08062.1 ABC transporter permease [Paracoccus versutus]MBT0781261.1 branched-chain amino acid ABC transporter permease [Paracoccus sp. pheM1]RDD68632.1 branched-chain amino acid ABC transporter permease [Paracoccus versutus]REF73054.1 amino acid/amide ABC transporter membrane protein 1 (HAAT family) [Paracoccus versutu
MFQTIVPLFVDALANAALIFFVAFGLTLVFSVLRILNVAHGSFYSIGAYVSASIGLWIVSAGLNPWLTFPALLVSAALVAALFGPLIERTLVQWTYGRGEAVQILMTFGLFLILEDLQRLVFGVSSYYEDTPVALLGSIEIGGIIYLNYQLLLIALAVVALVAMRVFIGHTRMGRLLAVVVADREISEALGIDTRRMFTIAFTLGIFLAALGGALATPTAGVAPGLGADTMVLAFAVAAIGGLGQVEGAALAAVIVAAARVLAIYLFPALDAVAPYLVMLIVLLVRPYGLFGKPAIRRI